MGSTVKLANDLYLETSSIVHKQGSQITPLDTYLDTIIESGSNDNGEYVKFYDGTMICTKHANFGQKSVSNPWGSLYETGEITIGDYPQAFIERPIVSITPDSTFFVEKNGSSTTNTSWGSFWAVRPVALTMYIAVECIAIGKWK